MDKMYGSIDLTKLGVIVREHPELIKEVTFKNGEVHKFLTIYINNKNQEDQYGNVAYIKAGVKREEEKQGVNYYLADLKLSKFNDNQGGNTQQAQSQYASQQQYAPQPPVAPPPPVIPTNDGDLPF